MEKFLRANEIAEALALSKSAFYRLVQEGRFPEVFSPTDSRASRWLEADVVEYQQRVVNAVPASRVPAAAVAANKAKRAAKPRALPSER